MTNPLDLIKRLADALDDDQRGQLDAFQRTALVTEARAFCMTRRELQQWERLQK